MNENKTNINWYPGHMAKTKRQIKEKIDLIDIIYEVVDSRIPISSKIKDIDENINKTAETIVDDNIDKKEAQAADSEEERFGYWCRRVRK